LHYHGPAAVFLRLEWRAHPSDLTEWRTSTWFSGQERVQQERSGALVILYTQIAPSSAVCQPSYAHQVDPPTPTNPPTPSQNKAPSCPCLQILHLIFFSFHDQRRLVTTIVTVKMTANPTNTGKLYWKELFRCCFGDDTFSTSLPLWIMAKGPLDGSTVIS
jgi:hypothetical protein